jgi:hypothetical protein
MAVLTSQQENQLANGLDHYIWPQIQGLMLNDAYFKLVRYFHEITQRYNEPIARLIVDGYVTSQLVTIRRLCDEGRTTISLRRLIIESSISNQKEFLNRLDGCERICKLTSDHIAHKGNPLRRPEISDWNLTDSDLTAAQRTLCEMTFALEQKRQKPKGYVRIIPEVLRLDMREFDTSAEDTKKLWAFWHAHNDAVNAWIS